MTRQKLFLSLILIPVLFMMLTPATMQAGQTDATRSLSDYDISACTPELYLTGDDDDDTPFCKTQGQRNNALNNPTERSSEKTSTLLIDIILNYLIMEVL